MGNYNPNPVTGSLQDLPEWTLRELRRAAAAIADDSDTLHFITPYAADASLSSGISINWKCANAPIVRCSTSNTITIGGIAYKVPKQARTYLNVGTGVLAFKNEDANSSASYRLALPAALYQISAGHAVTIWYDPSSRRHRPISRT
jgi:hypothetical protein